MHRVRRPGDDADLAAVDVLVGPRGGVDQVRVDGAAAGSGRSAPSSCWRSAAAGARRGPPGSGRSSGRPAGSPWPAGSGGWGTPAGHVPDRAWRRPARGRRRGGIAADAAPRRLDGAGVGVVRRRRPARSSQPARRQRTRSAVTARRDGGGGGRTWHGVVRLLGRMSIASARHDERRRASPPSYRPGAPAPGCGRCPGPAHPKFLHDLTGSGRSLLQQTWDRLDPLAGAGVLVVTGARACRGGRAPSCPTCRPGASLVEPARATRCRRSAWPRPCCADRDPDALIGSFAADHVIRDAAAFDAAVREAVAVARTGLARDDRHHPDLPGHRLRLHRARGPARRRRRADGARPSSSSSRSRMPTTAAGYVAMAGSVGTQGCSSFGPRPLLELLRLDHPALEASLREIAAGLGRPGPDGDAGPVWPGIEAIAIDHAVAEPAAAAGRVACVPADLGWDDVGTGPRCGLLPEPAPERRGCSATPGGCSRWTAPASSCRPVVARSSSSAWTTSSSSTPRTPSWSCRPTRPSGSRTSWPQLAAAGRTDLL